jgi:hypothetical protein
MQQYVSLCYIYIFGCYLFLVLPCSFLLAVSHAVVCIISECHLHTKILHNYKGRNDIGCRMYVALNPHDDGYWINRNICRGLLIYNKKKKWIAFCRCFINSLLHLNKICRKVSASCPDGITPGRKLLVRTEQEDGRIEKLFSHVGNRNMFLRFWSS